MTEKSLPKGHIEGKEEDISEDWTPINEKLPYLVYSDSEDHYKCTEHDTKIADKARVTRHLHEFHGVNQDGSKYEKEPEQNGKKLERSNDTSERLDFDEGLDITPSEKKLLEAWGEDTKEEENKEVGDDAFDIHKRRRAEAISRVMENPYVSMFFVEARNLKMFPPTFDEGDIIREALEYLGKHMGFGINVNYRPENVTDPELRNKMRYAAKAWDSFNEGDEDG